MTHLRVGLIHASSSTEMRAAIREQLLGVRLAAEYTIAHWGVGGPTLTLIDQAVTDDPTTVDEAARELLYRQACHALIGVLTVPLSIRAAEWAEKEGVLYVAANNNPKVWDGRRHVFHIGVPSEITGRAVARFLDEQGGRRVYLLHTSASFHVHAARCTAEAMAERGIAVTVEQIAEAPSNDGALLERIRISQPDMVCMLGSELERLVMLVRRARHVERFPPILLGRAMLCRDFADSTEAAGEGQFFTDLYFRDHSAPEEEQALRQRLETVSSELVATANHGFGWDGLRLVVEALRAAGPRPADHVAFLEHLKMHWAATGALTFGPQDHNGRSSYDPTTIARLFHGSFAVVSRLGR